VTTAAIQLADKLLPDVDANHANAGTLAINIRQTIADYDARHIPIPSDLAGAYRIVVARMLNSVNERTQAVGARMIREALVHNLNLASTVHDADAPKGGTTVNVAVVQVRRIVVEQAPAAVERP